MSDFSGLQPFGGATGTLVPAFGEMPAPSNELQPYEVDFRRLRQPQEIARVLHLRSEIALPSSALSDAGFAAREKKETRSAWSARWCATANTSGRSATCR